jgi:hypothetical protein
MIMDKVQFWENYLGLLVISHCNDGKSRRDARDVSGAWMSSILAPTSTWFLRGQTCL